MEKHITWSILCIDDEPEVLELLRRVLSQDGYKLYFAETAEEGFCIMQETEIDVVLCDYYMPEITGGQFLTEVRQKWPQTVRLLITGYADFEAAVQAINECKVFRMILKPWNNQQLRITVKEALQFKRHLQNLLNKVRDQDGFLINL